MSSVERSPIAGTTRGAAIYYRALKIGRQAGRQVRHYQADVLTVIDQGWDLFIAHPDCTYLCSSGLHWNLRRPGRSDQTERALAFVRALMAAPIGRIAIENPRGRIGTAIRKADQVIQPYEFGDDASKETHLWLKGLPALRKDPAQRVAGRLVTLASGRVVERWANQTDSGQNRLGPSANRWALRAQTYAGIAAAMAEQWGNPEKLAGFSLA